MSTSPEGERLPQAECFAGTTVPLLTVEGDHWLALAMPPGIDVDEVRIAKMNNAATISLGGAAAEREMRQRVADSDTGHPLFVRSILNVASHARSLFIKLIAPTADAAFHGLQYDVHTPLSVIETSRLVYQYAGDAFEGVVRDSKGIVYGMLPATLQRRLERFESSDVNGGILLQMRPDLLQSDRRGRGFRDALVAARKAEEQFGRRQSRSTPRTRLVYDQLDGPSRGNIDRVAAAAGIDPKLLAEGEPDVAALGEAALHMLLEHIAPELDARLRSSNPGGLRVRDIARLIAQVQKDNE